MRIYFGFLLITLLPACKEHLDLNTIRSTTWRYEEGYKVGALQFMTFKSFQDSFKLSHDTIYFNGKATATISRLSSDKLYLYLSSIETKQKGVYSDINISLYKGN